MVYLLAFSLIVSYLLELKTMKEGVRKSVGALPAVSLMVLCEEAFTVAGGLLVHDEWVLYSRNDAIWTALGHFVATGAIVIMCIRKARLVVEEPSSGFHPREDVLRPTQILVTMGETGVLCSKIKEACLLSPVVGLIECLGLLHSGLGLWAYYVLSLEMKRLLSSKKREVASGFCRNQERCRVKSLTNTHAESVVDYCKREGVRAMVPTCVEDSIFIAQNYTDLQAAGVASLTCENQEIYRTLDHKWLSHKFCLENGFRQPLTLPLREDTLLQCRNMAASVFPSGPCFIKRTFNTWAGLGVWKVHTLDEYDKVVATMQARGLVKAATASDDEIDVIVQEGHPGSIFGSQCIWYKGALVSVYVWKESMAVVSNMSATIAQTLAGCCWCKKEEPSMTQVGNPALKAALVKLLSEVGDVAAYTGMMDVEFLAEEVDQYLMTPIINIMEFNPRFSGGVHASLRSGFLEDYFVLLSARVQGVADEETPRRASWPHIRSDGHVPNCNLQNFNPLCFYIRMLWQLVTLRSL